MILIAFTNYSSTYNNPKELFDWVGMYNFEVLLGINGGESNQFAAVFVKILTWTLIWAFFATFTNYFLGMVVAMRKEILPLIENSGLEVSNESVGKYQIYSFKYLKKRGNKKILINLHNKLGKL